MRPTDRTSRQTTAEAHQGRGRGKRRQDGAGRPSAWDTPGHLACGAAGPRPPRGWAPGSAALSWHFGGTPPGSPSKPPSPPPRPRLAPSTLPPLSPGIPRVFGGRIPSPLTALPYPPARGSRPPRVRPHQRDGEAVPRPARRPPEGQGEPVLVLGRQPARQRPVGGAQLGVPPETEQDLRSARGDLCGSGGSLRPRERGRGGDASDMWGLGSSPTLRARGCAAGGMQRSPWRRREGREGSNRTVSGGPQVQEGKVKGVLPGTPQPPRSRLGWAGQAGGAGAGPLGMAIGRGRPPPRPMPAPHPGPCPLTCYYSLL